MTTDTFDDLDEPDSLEEDFTPISEAEAVFRLLSAGHAVDEVANRQGATVAEVTTLARQAAREHPRMDRALALTVTEWRLDFLRKQVGAEAHRARSDGAELLRILVAIETQRIELIRERRAERLVPRPGLAALAKLSKPTKTTPPPQKEG